MLLDVDPALARHLAVAVAAHCRRLRRDGLTPPAALDRLTVAFLASSGQGRTTLDGSGSGADGAPVTLTVDDREAGDALSVSDRTVRRLVAEGRLPAVDVGGRRRIRVVDLAEYVESLVPVNGTDER